MKLAPTYGGHLADYFDGRESLEDALRHMFNAQPSTEHAMPHPPIQPSPVFFHPGIASSAAHQRVPVPQPPRAADPDRTAVAADLPAQLSDYRPPRRRPAPAASKTPAWVLPVISASCGATGGAVVMAIAWVMSR